MKPLVQGVRLTALFDSCHSGTAMDLPFLYTPTGAIKIKSKWSQLKEVGKTGISAFLYKNPKDVMKLFQKVTHLGKDTSKQQNEKMSAADVIMFSGCKDSQTSADATIQG